MSRVEPPQAPCAPDRLHCAPTRAGTRPPAVMRPQLRPRQAGRDSRPGGSNPPAAGRGPKARSDRYRGLEAEKRTFLLKQRCAAGAGGRGVGTEQSTFSAAAAAAHRFCLHSLNPGSRPGPTEAVLWQCVRHNGTGPRGKLHRQARTTGTGSLSHQKADYSNAASARGASWCVAV